MELTKYELAEDLEEKILELLPYTPLEDQQKLVKALSKYTYMRDTRDVLVVDGYAGTGKSSLMGAYVNAARRVGAKVVLLAPTGRAAKVFSAFSGLPASTIHRRIYRPAGSTGIMKFVLSSNRQEDTIFIVDEASMISDHQEFNKSLLQQLIRYVYSAPGCSLILMGDTAQLPPVGQLYSNAMNKDRLVSLGLNPTVFNLVKSARQIFLDGILLNATRVRKFVTGEEHPTKLKLHASSYSDQITVVDGRDLEDYYTSSISRYGHRETIIVTRSNYRAAMINAQVRWRILDFEEELNQGEKVMIAKNNYFWARSQRNSLIANGDIANIDWVGSIEEKFGYRFVEAELTFPGRDEPVGAKIMLDSLYHKSSALTPEEMMRFHAKVLQSYDGELSQRLRSTDSDPYYNALQIKHAYCITCHKAQGGQWREVYIDMGGITPENMDGDFYRWLYTALTRSTGHVYLINPTIPVT